MARAWILCSKIVLENFSAYKTHFEDLAHNDSGREKRAQIKDWLNLWKEANLLVNLSVYLDILPPLQRLSLGLQEEKHDLVQHVRRIQELAWTMAKLQIVTDNTLDDDKHIAYYKRFRDSFWHWKLLKKALMKLLIKGLS